MTVIEVDGTRAATAVARVAELALAAPDPEVLRDRAASVLRDLFGGAVGAEVVSRPEGALSDAATDLVHRADVEVSELSEGARDVVEAVAEVVVRAADRVGVWAEARTQARVLDALGVAVLATDGDGRIRYWNPAAATLLGYRAGEVLAHPAVTLASPETLASVRADIRAAVIAGRPWVGELDLEAKDGSPIPVRLVATALAGGEPPRATVVALSDQRSSRALEWRRRQAAKLEAVGQLAGGIAHDFNNILGAILGHADLLLQRSDLPKETRVDVAAIRRSVDRASLLTRKLLAFGRRRVLSPVQIDPADVLRRLVPDLQASMPVGIDLRVEVAEEVGAVRMDRGGLEEVILTLATNAIEAMAGGGILTVRLRGVVPDADLRAAVDELPDGPCVALSVGDTGSGISASDVHQVFDPFFSTKGLGRGLGLAAVYGTVQQSGGAITIETHFGMGSVFTVYLPRIPGAPRRRPEAAAPAVATHPARLLVVEDDDLLRRVVTRVLETEGYVVVAAANGADALAAAGLEGLPDLVVTDVSMPGLDGPALAARLRDRGPVPVLFISGLAAREDVARALAEPQTELLEKPFTPAALLETVTRLLGD